MRFSNRPAPTPRATARALALAGLATFLALPSAAATPHDDAFLGISSRGLRGEEARRMDLPSRDGALIERVHAGTAAEATGLRRGDLIVEFDGSRIYDDTDLTDRILERSPGDRVSILVLRDGEPLRLDAELGAREESRSEAGSGPPWVQFLESLFGSDAHHRSGPLLGVNVMELDPQLASYFGVSEEGGVLITEVLRNTPAERSGIRAGDVVVGVAGSRVAEAGDISDALAGRWGETVPVQVVRERDAVKILATLEEE